MKTLSIRDLHLATGKHVRSALEEPVVITERGRRIAVIKAFSDSELSGAKFPRRRAASLPRVDYDSTSIISADRDSR